VSALAAAQFLTRIPIRLRREPSLGDAVPWFPVVGLVVGAAAGAAAAGLWHVVPPAVAAACAMAVALLITGAFHEDGLADVADAFGGGWTVERRLEILKDPRHGTYGVASMCTSIVLRIICVASLPGPLQMFAGLTAAHCMGRTAAVGLMGTAPIAAQQGLGADYARGLSPARTIAGVGGGVVLTVLVCGWWAAPLIGGALVGAGAVGLLAQRKIGGVTGDVLGACEQVVECLSLIVFSGLAMHASFGDAIWYR
jgi:adenosylcobinamide-GDP ribazoletransferase